MAFATIGNSALTGSIDLTSKVTGTLPTANGGTGATSFAPGKVLQVKTKFMATSVATTSGTLATILTSDTITLSSSSNSLYVIASILYDLQGYASTTDPGGEFRLYDQAGNQLVKTLVEINMTDNNDGIESTTVMQGFYSPPDTSETVNIQYRCGAGQLRARGSDVYPNCTALTVMEIAA